MDQHNEWKRHRWQKMNTRALQDETDKQLGDVKALPAATHNWDVYYALFDSIVDIQVS